MFGDYLTRPAAGGYNLASIDQQDGGRVEVLSDNGELAPGPFVNEAGYFRLRNTRRYYYLEALRGCSM